MSDSPQVPGLQVSHATLADQLPIRRMLELYQHDLSHIWDQDLDEHGEYGYALLLLSSACLLVALLLRRRQLRDQGTV